MANYNYTSSQSGNFSNPSTWGGSGYPNTNGDTFIVSTGHTVTVDIDNTSISLGASTVNGTLNFATTGTVGLKFNNNLTINGTLQLGNSTSPILGVARLLWAVSGDNSFGLVLGTDGIIEANGTFTKEISAKLIDNSENTDNDTDIIIDNSNTGWQVGDELIIRVKKSGSSNIATNGFVYRTITAINGANITLNSSVTIDNGVGNTWVGYVYNVTRNIIIGHASPTKNIGTYNTNRPYIRINDNNTKEHYINNVSFFGIHSVGSTGSAYFNFLKCKFYIDNCVFGFGEHVLHSNASNFVFNNCVVISNNYAIRNSFNISVNNSYIICNAYPYRSGNNLMFNNTFFVCNGSFGIDVTDNILTNCKFIANNMSSAVITYAKYNNCSFADNVGVFLNSNDIVTYTNCKFGYDGDLQESNVADISINGLIKAILKNCVYNESTFPILSNTSSVSYLINKYCLYIENGNFNNIHKIWQTEGEAIRIVCDGSGTKPSVGINGQSGEYAIAITNLQSRLGFQNNYIIALKEDNFIFDLQGNTKTIKAKIQSTFTNTLTNNDIYMVVTYYNTNGEIVKATSTNSIIPRVSKSDWSQSLSVQIQANLVIGIQIYLTKYEAGKEIFIGVPILIE